ncbi:MAG: winged helix-turn-helix domain-containing protein [Acidobacteria bacterium]|nr:winged helix-turn-helix domain-containing protein [Acidobacteriota bacterium]
MDKGGQKSGSIYEFGKFILDSRERVLLADGVPVHLTGKVFDTLLLLIEHNGRLLTKVEMMSALWAESFVEEGNLAKNISRLRKILNTEGAELIETLPKRGYRFQAAIRQLDGEAGLLVHRSLNVRFSSSLEESDAETSPSRPSVLNEVQSLAVLPFEPLGAKAAEDFFGLGLTDALITQLSRAGQVQVRPTSSILDYNSSEKTAVSFGRELRVDAVLEGRFQRFENKLRLTVQMLHTKGGNALWADSFNAEFDDVFSLQDQIAERVVHALNRKLTAESQTRLRKRYTENVEAYQEYLKGRYYWNKCTLIGYEKAIECFKRAIDTDPLYALAYAGLAGIYNVLPLIDGFAPRDYFPKAKAAALRALEIDSQLAEAHTAFGLAILHYDWNWSGAEVAFDRAIKADPNYSNAYELLGVYLCRVERIAESISALKKAGELDPLSPIHDTWLAEVLRYCGETEASIRIHEETLRSFPEFYPAHYHLSFSFLDSGRLDDAESHCERAVSLSNQNSLTLSLRGILQAARGNSRAVQETSNKLLQMKADRYISSANIASVYAASGDEEKTIEWLETAVEERDPNLTWIRFDREFEFLERDPRFQVILQKVGLADRSPSSPDRRTR